MVGDSTIIADFVTAQSAPSARGGCPGWYLDWRDRGCPRDCIVPDYIRTKVLPGNLRTSPFISSIIRPADTCPA